MTSISQELRQAVLQAAIQGKLTRQLPEDGDARNLLEQIKYEKERLIKEKKIKKEKLLAPISEDAVPFDIPESWEWVRLGSVSETNIGLTYQPIDVVPDGVLVLRSSNIQNGKMSYNDNVFVNCAVPSRAMISKGDVLICVRNGSKKLVGKSAIVDRDGMAFGAFMAKVHSKFIDARYIQFYIESHVFRGALDNVGTETINQITQEMLKNSLFPLPPLAEQHRIVSRVEELMAKIDELEKIENELKALHQAFPGDMKAALLQAAMQGKLTKHLPDENLEEINANLIIDQKAKVPDELPFDIPQNWEWIPIANLGASVDTDSFSDGPFGSNLKKEHQILEPQVRIIQLSNIGENGWRDENKKYTSFSHLETVIPRCEVTPGCFVIAKMMPAGRTIIVPDLGTRITLGSDAMKFKPNPILNKNYLLYAMRSQAFLSQVYAEVHGITRVRTTLKGVKSYVLPIPPLVEQKRIVERLDKLLPLCDSLHTE